ncbi:MAG: 50S ribosomal protein L29 [Proteobacteria bacterium]|nr:50S ribosomal protein L29 [Pseudomonadota bacterium]
MKMDNIRELDAGALQKREAELREELFNLKFQHAIGKLENTSRLSVLRKDIAKVLTMKNTTISTER